MKMIPISSIHINSKGSCGYCEKGLEGKWAISGFQTSLISAEDYYDLMDRGWRRCGQYYYKANLQECCCRPYTIRLNITQFQKVKKFSKTIKKFENFINGDTVGKKEKIKQNKSFYEQFYDPIIYNAFLNFKEYLTQNQQEMFKILGCTTERIKLNNNSITLDKIKLFKTSPKYGDYTTNVCLIIYHQFTDIWKKLQYYTIRQFTDKIQEFFFEYFKQNLQQYYIMIQKNGHISFISKFSTKKSKCILSFEQNDNLIPLKKDETEQDTNQKELRKLRFKEQQTGITNQKKLFEIKFEKASFDIESYDLYRKYCLQIHKKTRVTMDDYKDFLCQQAIENSTKKADNGLTIQYGCYHMKYFLDGSLIAISVIDIMPQAMSSVYFFYDPDYKKFSIGVIGTLKNIEFIQKLQTSFPEFTYYYQGYYIPTNLKMAYKADYEPVQILCPEKYQWVDMNSRIMKLILGNSSRAKITSDDGVSINEDMDFDHQNIDKFVCEEIKLLIGDKQFKINQINPIYQKLLKEKFCNLVQILGKKLSKKLIFGQS